MCYLPATTPDNINPSNLYTKVIHSFQFLDTCQNTTTMLNNKTTAIVSSVASSSSSLPSDYRKKDLSVVENDDDTLKNKILSSTTNNTTPSSSSNHVPIPTLPIINDQRHSETYSSSASLYNHQEMPLNKHKLSAAADAAAETIVTRQHNYSTPSDDDDCMNASLTMSQQHIEQTLKRDDQELYQTTNNTHLCYNNSNSSESSSNDHKEEQTPRHYVTVIPQEGGKTRKTPEREHGFSRALQQGSQVTFLPIRKTLSLKDVSSNVLHIDESTTPTAAISSSSSQYRKGSLIQFKQQYSDPLYQRRTLSSCFLRTTATTDHYLINNQSPSLQKMVPRKKKIEKQSTPLSISAYSEEASNHKKSSSSSSDSNHNENCNDNDDNNNNNNNISSPSDVSFEKNKKNFNQFDSALTPFPYPLLASQNNGTLTEHDPLHYQPQSSNGYYNQKKEKNKKNIIGTIASSPIVTRQAYSDNMLLEKEKTTLIPRRHSFHNFVSSTLQGTISLTTSFNPKVKEDYYYGGSNSSSNVSLYSSSYPLSPNLQNGSNEVNDNSKKQDSCYPLCSSTHEEVVELKAFSVHLASLLHKGFSSTVWLCNPNTPLNSCDDAFERGRISLRQQQSNGFHKDKCRHNSLSKYVSKQKLNCFCDDNQQQPLNSDLTNSNITTHRLPIEIGKKDDSVSLHQQNTIPNSNNHINFICPIENPSSSRETCDACRIVANDSIIPYNYYKNITRQDGQDKNDIYLSTSSASFPYISFLHSKELFNNDSIDNNLHHITENMILNRSNSLCEICFGSLQGGTFCRCSLHNYSFGNNIKQCGTVCSLGSEESDSSSKTAVVMKVVHKTKCSEEELARLSLEASFLANIHHPHIIPLLSVINSATEQWMFFEHAPLGDLQSAISFKTVSEDACQWIIFQLLLALRDIHEIHHIIHCDVKPQNILMFEQRGVYESYRLKHTVSCCRNKDKVLLSGHENTNELTKGTIAENWQDICLKLTDFGLAQKLSCGQQEVDFNGLKGTHGYFAPELLMKQSYGYKIDMWSLGIIAFILIAGYEPFYPVSSCIKEELEFDLRYWGDVSSEAKDFIRSLLQRNPSKRLNAREALNHDWMKYTFHILDTTLSH